MRCIGPVVCLMFASLAVAQTPVADEPAQDPARDQVQAGLSPRLQENIGTLLQSFKSLGNWDEQSGYMIGAVEQVYEQNGWSSESDNFSLDLIRSIESKPPWAFQERFDTLVGMVSDRYMLDEDQEQSLRELIVAETTETFRRHAPRIMEYAVEALQVRASGEPFTPEQVQRWIKLAGPVIDDSRERMMRAADGFLQKLDPEQQEIVRRDLAADEDRFNHLVSMREKWERGEWEAADWGMDKDPIQNGTRAKPAEGAASGAAAENGAAGGQNGDREAIRRMIEERARQRATEKGNSDSNSPEAPVGDGSDAATGPKSDSASKSGTRKPGGDSDVTDNDPWSRYVRDFIRRFKLNDDQSQRAWAIFSEAKDRRDALERRYTSDAAAMERGGESATSDSAKDKGKSDAGSPAQRQLESRKKTAVDRLFDQLKRRLDRLPTRAQRKAAESAGPAKGVTKSAPTTQNQVNPVESIGP